MYVIVNVALSAHVLACVCILQICWSQVCRIQAKKGALFEFELEFELALNHHSHALAKICNIYKTADDNKLYI